MTGLGIIGAETSGSITRQVSYNVMSPIMITVQIIHVVSSVTQRL